jgi:uncharacterized membrane protein
MSPPSGNSPELDGGETSAALGPPTGISRREVLKMQAAAQNADAVRILVVLAAIAIVAFWRTVLRLVIILVAAATIAGMGYGAIAVWHGMQHVRV